MSTNCCALWAQRHGQISARYRADATAKTERRHLSCLHLLALVPRQPQTDLGTLDLLREVSNLDVNAKEEVDGLTALHFVVRNQKFELARELPCINVHPSIPFSDHRSRPRRSHTRTPPSTLKYLLHSI